MYLLFTHYSTLRITVHYYTFFSLYAQRETVSIKNKVRKHLTVSNLHFVTYSFVTKMIALRSKGTLLSALKPGGLCLFDYIVLKDTVNIVTEVWH